MDQLTKEVTALKEQINILTARQDNMTKMLAENNVLLRRNLGLFEVTHTLFPIHSDDEMKKLENDLATEKKQELVCIRK